MNLSGSTGLDQTIDYSGKIKLPASAGDIAKLTTLDLKIGGTFSSPKVSLDTEKHDQSGSRSSDRQGNQRNRESSGLDSATTAQQRFREGESKRESRRKGTRFS